MLSIETRNEIDGVLEVLNKKDAHLMISFIEKVIKDAPEMFEREGYAKHWGLCSVIHEKMDFGDGKLGSYLRGIIHTVPGTYVIKDSDVIVEEEGGPFMWEPSKIAPRIKFLKEVRQYIINKL